MIKQIYNKTPEVLMAEKEIRRYIIGNPLPFEKIIPHRLFDPLLKETPKAEHKKYSQEGIPFKHEADGSSFDYILRVKHEN